MSVGTIVGSGINLLVIGVLIDIIGYAVQLLQGANIFNNLMLSYDCLTFVSQIDTMLYVAGVIFALAGFVNMIITARNDAANGGA
jgi:hypothetical protein